MAGREMELMLEITRWDAPGLLGFKILNVPFPLEATEYVYRLEPEDGGTRLTLDGEIKLVRFLRFATGWIGKMCEIERTRTQHGKAIAGSGLSSKVCWRVWRRNMDRADLIF